jgi:hypothetical protein
MSPEVSIKPFDLVLRERCTQFAPDLILSESLHCQGNRFTDGEPHLRCQPLQFLMRCYIDAYTCALHTQQYTDSYAFIKRAGEKSPSSVR